MRTFQWLGLPVIAALCAAFSPAAAQEVKTYTYDALGRLVEVKNTNGPNNNTTTSYNYDPASNRTQVSTTGSSNPGGGGNNGGGTGVTSRQGFVVTPLGGYALIFYRD